MSRKDNTAHGGGLNFIVQLGINKVKMRYGKATCIKLADLDTIPRKCKCFFFFFASVLFFFFQLYLWVKLHLQCLRYRIAATPCIVVTEINIDVFIIHDVFPQLNLSPEVSWSIKKC